MTGTAERDGAGFDVLFTGFEPFLNYARNPSWEVASAAAEAFAGRAEAALIPVTYAAAASLPATWTRARLVVSIGVADRTRVEVETLARNARGDSPDNAQEGGTAVLHPGRPDVLFAPEAAEFASRLAEVCPLPVATSDDAGGYVCNAMLYGLLANCPVSAMFVHVPDLDPQQARAVGEALAASTFEFLQRSGA